MQIHQFLVMMKQIRMNAIQDIKNDGENCINQFTQRNLTQVLQKMERQ